MIPSVGLGLLLHGVFGLVGRHEVKELIVNVGLLFQQGFAHGASFGLLFHGVFGLVGRHEVKEVIVNVGLLFHGVFGLVSGRSRGHDMKYNCVGNL